MREPSALVKRTAVIAANAAIDASVRWLVGFAISRADRAENIVKFQSTGGITPHEFSRDIHLKQNIIGIEKKGLGIVDSQNVD